MLQRTLLEVTDLGTMSTMSLLEVALIGLNGSDLAIVLLHVSLHPLQPSRYGIEALLRLCPLLCSVLLVLCPVLRSVLPIIGPVLRVVGITLGLGCTKSFQHGIERIKGRGALGVHVGGHTSVARSDRLSWVAKNSKRGSGGSDRLSWVTVIMGGHTSSGWSGCSWSGTGRDDMSQILSGECWLLPGDRNLTRTAIAAGLLTLPLLDGGINDATETLLCRLEEIKRIREGLNNRLFHDGATVLGGDAPNGVDGLLLEKGFASIVVRDDLAAIALQRARSRT